MRKSGKPATVLDIDALRSATCLAIVEKPEDAWKFDASGVDLALHHFYKARRQHFDGCQINGILIAAFRVTWGS